MRTTHPSIMRWQRCYLATFPKNRRRALASISTRCTVSSSSACTYMRQTAVCRRRGSEKVSCLHGCSEGLDIRMRQLLRGWFDGRRWGEMLGCVAADATCYGLRERGEAVQCIERDGVGCLRSAVVPSRTSCEPRPLSKSILYHLPTSHSQP